MENKLHPKNKFRKFQSGGNILGLKVPKSIEIGASFLPIVGTAMDIKEAIDNPTGENIGYAVLSLGSDLLGLSIIKGLTKTGKAIKAAKKLEKASESMRSSKEGLEAARKAKSLSKTGNPKKIQRADEIMRPYTQAQEKAYQARWKANDLVQYGEDIGSFGDMLPFYKGSGMVIDFMANLQQQGIFNQKRK